MATLLPLTTVCADGGYFTRADTPVAVSADQRAILIQDGNEISMTVSTGYTGEGGDFGWIIPTPMPPEIGNVREAGETGETAFRVLDQHTAPVIVLHDWVSSGCFPAGTEVLTIDGPRAIETLIPGDEVHSYDQATGQWAGSNIVRKGTYHFTGDMVTIQAGTASIKATANHPFFVMRGNLLDARPAPREVPPEEQKETGNGRWVEARDLEIGDLLMAKSGAEIVVHHLSIKQVEEIVHHLEVEPHHNYAVHRIGVLVHNAPKTESGRDVTNRDPLVQVHGRVSLEHYEVSILSARDSTALLNWLGDNDYQVDTEARGIFDAYIDRRWAFVAVKLHPEEKRYYENELLPPLTIGYQHHRLVFPLVISSISTAQTARITLYVIAESTVSSSNFPTGPLIYRDTVYPFLEDSLTAHRSGLLIDVENTHERYIEMCIARSSTMQGGGFLVLWSGSLTKAIAAQAQIRKIHRPYSRRKEYFLTRLDARMHPSAMTQDVEFILDSYPEEFRVEIHDERRTSAIPYLVRYAREGQTDDLKRHVGSIDVNALYDWNWTLLMHAVMFNRTHIAKMLIDNGADANLKNDSGSTALMWASVNGNEELVMALIDAGADVNAQNKGGVTALLIATGIGLWALEEIDLEENPNQFRWADRSGIVPILLESGANPSAQDRLGNTALMGGAFTGRIDDVLPLLEAGADVNAQNNGGFTALMAAAQRGHVDIVELLLAAGASVDMHTQAGKTALWFAMDREHVEIVDMLD